MIDRLKEIHGEPSHELATTEVELSITRRGGQMAPVYFNLEDRRINPYSLSPWEPREVDPNLPPLLQVLRGDFFCIPFGPNPWNERHYHGDTANAEWTLEERSDRRIHLSMAPGDIGGRVDKIIHLTPGQSVVYQEHRISGVSGDLSYGNHPILDFGNCDPDAARISVSRFKYGTVYRGLFSNPESREYASLKPSAEFTNLKEVPMADGGVADLSRYPSRRGFEDLIMLSTADEIRLAWTAVVMNGCVWYSLKDPRDFPTTLFWISNGGRHAAPWNGSHLARIGFEEVCSYQCDSVLESRAGHLRSRRIATTARFHPDREKVLRIAQGMVRVDDTFSEVARIEPVENADQIRITDTKGRLATAEVDWGFVIAPTAP